VNLSTCGGRHTIGTPPARADSFNNRILKGDAAQG
jgi:hypothetical protein